MSQARITSILWQSRCYAVPLVAGSEALFDTCRKWSGRWCFRLWTWVAP